MTFHENRLLADDSHEIPCLICYYCKSCKICNCGLLQIIGGALWDTIFLSNYYNNLEYGYPHSNELENVHPSKKSSENVLLGVDSEGVKKKICFSHHILQRGEGILPI